MDGSSNDWCWVITQSYPAGEMRIEGKQNIITVRLSDGFGGNNEAEKDMGDFYNPHEYRKAAKPHRCTYCGEVIYKGEQYTFQKGNYDGRWFETKMHDECFDDMAEYGDGEYTLYNNERPQRAEVTPNAEVWGDARPHRAASHTTAVLDTDSENT